MSPTRWALSLAFVAHLSALLIGSLPPPQVLDPRASRAVEGGRIVHAVSPALDWTAARVFRAHAALWALTRPIRAPFDAYLGMFKLNQTWNMFWDPPQYDKYLRLRYFIGNAVHPHEATGGISIATELILPLDNEEAFRPFYSSSVSRNKAIATALDNFHRKARDQAAGNVRQAAPDDLFPVVRYFADRFERQHLTAGDRVVHAQAWYGFVRTTPPGAQSGSVRAERESVLRRYHQGPIRTPADHFPYATIRATEREADIQWVLEYVTDIVASGSAQ